LRFFILFLFRIPSKKGKVYRFYNCRILKDHKIITDNFYVQDGIIINPEKLFFEEKISPDVHIDCKNAIICPGFIDIQINGKYIYRYRDIVLANEMPTGSKKNKHTCSKQHKTITKFELEQQNPP